MAFTTRTITHTFKNVDGTAGSGTLVFSLTKRMTNGTQTYLPAAVTATLDGSGNLSVTLPCTTDATTSPQDALWRVDFHLSYLGTQNEEPYYFPLAPGASVDLGSLLPQGTIGQ